MLCTILFLAPSFEVTAYNQKLDMVTPEEILKDIMHAFTSRKMWVDYIMTLFKAIKAFLFLRVLLG